MKPPNHLKKMTNKEIFIFNLEALNIKVIFILIKLSLENLII